MATPQPIKKNTAPVAPAVTPVEADESVVQEHDLPETTEAGDEVDAAPADGAESPMPDISKGLAELPKYYERTDETFFSHAANVAIAGMVKYIEDMHPSKPQNPTTGGLHQRALFRALELAVEKTHDQEFEKVWKKLLDLAAPELKKGCFNDRYSHRFPESVPLSTAERQSFHGLLNLIMSTANPANRKAFFNIMNVRSLVKGSLSERAITRLVEYYEN